MDPKVVGRNAELAEIERWLVVPSALPSAFVLEGAPGIGKTTLWRAALERAPLPILSCRPAEAEAKLALAALADLLDPVADRVLDRLPAPQRAALEVALLRSSPAGAPPDARTVGAATLSLLRALAADAPLIVAVDDAQWLDRASASALAFALRRLDRPARLLVTVRIGAAGFARELDSLLAERVRRLRVPPLDLRHLHQVLSGALDHAFPRPALRRVADASDGNPLFAIELGRALLDAGALPAAGAPLPVPDTLAALLASRVGRLPAASRRVLLAAAALSEPTTEIVGRDGLARAEAAGIVTVADGRVRFSHPLLQSAVYTAASDAERRDVHRRLAAAVADPEERARHLALALREPDAAVAAMLDEAARRARARGAPDAAGELMERAAQLTPVADRGAILRRSLDAAEHLFAAGDRERSRALIEPVLADSAEPPVRAQALRLLGEITYSETSVPEAVALLEEALRHAQGENAVLARLDLAFALGSSGEFAAAVEHSRRAVADAERLGTRGLVAQALAIDTTARFLAGHGFDLATMRRALALEDHARTGQLLMRPHALGAMLDLYRGDFAAAAESLTRARERAIERGEEAELPFMLHHLAWLGWWTGDFAATLRATGEALALATQTDSETMRGIALVHRAMAHAHLGDVAAARAELDESHAIVERTGWGSGLPYILTTLGFLELSLDDPAAAAAAHAPLLAFVEAHGVAEPTVASFVPDAVEALVRRGERGRAERLLANWEARARAVDRTWAIASAQRCHGLLLADRGDLEGATVALEAALGLVDPLGIPVDLGRTLLALGRVRRRRLQRRAARDALGRAREVFERVGAALWAEQVAAELCRLPIRRGAGDELTTTERRVADLSAAGMTNREVAAAMYISPKTVEATLTRVYRKLGIRSRAELGAAMAQHVGNPP